MYVSPITNSTIFDSRRVKERSSLEMCEYQLKAIKKQSKKLKYCIQDGNRVSQVYKTNGLDVKKNI